MLLGTSRQHVRVMKQSLSAARSNRLLLIDVGLGKQLLFDLTQVVTVINHPGSVRSRETLRASTAVCGTGQMLVPTSQVESVRDVLIALDAVRAAHDRAVLSGNDNGALALVDAMTSLAIAVDVLTARSNRTRI